MRIFISIIGIIASFLLIKYREQAGDMIGEPAWASKVGGVYNLMIIVGIIIFFVSVANLSNTTDFLFAPIVSFFPDSWKAQPPAGF